MDEESIGFESLPLEILIKIYRHLNFYDIQSASLACKHWFSAAQFDEFNQKVLLKFSKILLSDILVPAETFINSFRNFPNLYFESIVIEDCEHFLATIGQSVKSIYFDGVKLQCEQFCNILGFMKNLKEITVSRTARIFDDSKFLIDPENVANICNTMADVTAVSLALPSPEIESIERLLSMVTYLEKLELDFAFSYHLSDTTKIAHVLKKIVTNNMTTLKELSLKHIVDTDDFLTSITVLNKFYLKKLTCIDITPWRSLLIFVTTQNHLVELDLSESDQMIDANVRLLVQFSVNLETLKLRRCTKITDLSLTAIVDELKLLKSLDLSYCEKISSYGIKETIASKINPRFIELYISGLELHPSAIIKICQSLPNLQILDIGNCMGVSNCIVQRIIIDLNKIRKLNMQNCKLISDYALTGINMESGKEEGFSIKRLTHLQYLNIKGCKQITDISFIKNANLIELEELCLPNIAICASDIKMLAEMCPAIIKLDLSECETMENVDKVMESFKNFKRLRIFQFAKFHINYINEKI